MSDLAGDGEKSPQTKIALRARLLTARRSLALAAHAAAAAAIQDQTLSLVRRTRPHTIAAYVPIGSEPGGPDLPALLASALPAGGQLLLPVLLPDGDLDWAVFTPLSTGSPLSGAASPSSEVVSPILGSPPPAAAAPSSPSPSSSLSGTSPAPPPSGLAGGPRGLLEPTGRRLGVDAIREADLVLVPALAVGRDGIRMGRGGGSYDRVLARLPQPGPLVVALLHDGEDVDSVPAEPHDRPVHAVITPTRGFSLRPGPEWTN
ncbi:5-formyltetrahydrofolate cyclo-ligase [Actinoplanes sp. NPDC051861]|uniref:5-formyltetrahydrofolate cyclo-ligase n=1 Tax=Actinoplanes sp. NPDC051861 TaxID=3155170 RepID=UPI00344A29CA